MFKLIYNFSLSFRNIFECELNNNNNIWSQLSMQDSFLKQSPIEKNQKYIQYLIYFWMAITILSCNIMHNFD